MDNLPRPDDASIPTSHNGLNPPLLTISRDMFNHDSGTYSRAEDFIAQQRKKAHWAVASEHTSCVSTRGGETLARSIPLPPTPDNVTVAVRKKRLLFLEAKKVWLYAVLSFAL